MSNSNSTERAPSQRLAKKRKTDENLLDNHDEEGEEGGGKTDNNKKIVLGFVSASNSFFHYFDNC